MDVPAGGGDAGGYEHLRSLFEKWDSNGNGVLEYPEIRDLLKELKGSDVSHDEVMEFYRCTDKNSDAKVDFMEFTTAYTQFTNLGPRGSKKRTIGSPEAKRQRDDVRTLEMQQFNLNYTPQQLLDEILAGHAEDELDLRMVMLGMDVTPKASKYAYLKGKTDLFGPYFEQLAPKLTPLLNGADSGGVLNCLHQVAQLLQITEVFSTEIERLKHKGYIHEVYPPSSIFLLDVYLAPRFFCHPPPFLLLSPIHLQTPRCLRLSKTPSPWSTWPSTSCGSSKRCPGPTTTWARTSAG